MFRLSLRSFVVLHLENLVFKKKSHEINSCPQKPAPPGLRGSEAGAGSFPSGPGQLRVKGCGGIKI